MIDSAFISCASDSSSFGDMTRSSLAITNQDALVVVVSMTYINSEHLLTLTADGAETAFPYIFRTVTGAFATSWEQAGWTLSASCSFRDEKVGTSGYRRSAALMANSIVDATSCSPRSELIIISYRLKSAQFLRKNRLM